MAKPTPTSNTPIPAAVTTTKPDPIGTEAVTATAPTAPTAPATESPKPIEPKPEVPAATAAEPNKVGPDRTILSLTVPEKLARQIRLLAKLEGVTISHLVLASAEREIPKRLKAALAAIADDEE